MRPNVHDWYARNFANAPLEVLVACSYNVALMLRHALHDAVIGVGALMLAAQSLKAIVLQNSADAIKC